MPELDPPRLSDPGRSHHPGPSHLKIDTMLDALKESIRLANEAWTGCCWETEFGPKKLNLNGLQMRQALIAAKATRGNEAECWHDAATWLAQVEADARSAADHTSRAFESAQAGDWTTAIKLVDQATDLASRYPVADQFEQCRALCEQLAWSAPATL